MSDATLRLTVVDAASRQPTPARVEVTDADGNSYIAADALPTGGDCGQREEPAWLSLGEALAGLPRKVDNPFTRTTQFYSAGGSELTLPAGAYSVKAYKGIEYSVAAGEFRLSSGETVNRRMEVRRWVNMPEKGWYSADDHLHIARSVPELNPYISKMMQAEDIHVGNLLQMGLAHQFNGAVQYAHGPEGMYREGDYLLAAGQENPRSRVLGHSIVLGARKPIHLPDEYLIYRLVGEEARRQGGLYGYAHFGNDFLDGVGGRYGLPVVLPRGLPDFIELMQFNHHYYDAWYDMLNLGFRVTPTAGTDYPCGPAQIPGRERFYTRVEGPLSYDAWLEAVRAGKTFVTNGPVLEFSVDGRGMGEELRIPGPGPVAVAGRALFDGARDDVTHLELVENGVVVRGFPRKHDAAEIAFEIEHQVREACWLALRVSGDKMGEVPMSREPTLSHSSAAHSAPVHIGVDGGAPLRDSPRGKDASRRWLAWLEDLEARLGESEISGLARRLARHPDDMVSEDVLRRNRSALLAEIRTARDYFGRS